MTGENHENFISTNKGNDCAKHLSQKWTSNNKLDIPLNTTKTLYHSILYLVVNPLAFAFFAKKREEEGEGEGERGCRTEQEEEREGGREGGRERERERRSGRPGHSKCKRIQLVVVTKTTPHTILHLDFITTTRIYTRLLITWSINQQTITISIFHSTLKFHHITPGFQVGF